MVEKSSSATIFATPSDREVSMTRVFAAPRRLVFEAWTKPEHLAHWFGRRGDTLSVCDVDLRVGGAWRFVFRLREGGEMGMKGVYREISPPQRLVYTEAFDEFEEMGEALNTLTFEERDGRTTLTATSLYPSRETRDAVIQSGMEDGAAETFDRLEEYLRTMA